jgi:nitrite reductase (NADH) small subunit
MKKSGNDDPHPGPLPARVQRAPDRAGEGPRPLCALTDIPQLGARVIERPQHPDGNVAVFRTAADGVFAILDRCPHKGGPLSQGIVFGDRVACPLHNWSIELATGEAVAPDVGCTRRFPAEVVHGVVYVDLG